LVVFDQLYLDAKLQVERERAGLKVRERCMKGEREGRGKGRREAQQEFL
jgi:hypothetical protein